MTESSKITSMVHDEVSTVAQLDCSHSFRKKQSPADIKRRDKFVGNVSNFAALPTDFKGRLSKGNLVFNACFEGGNLGRVDYISEYEYDLFIRPDTCNPKYRVWFNFTVSNTKIGQKAVFNIVNFSKTKSLYRNGMSPLVYSTSRPKWQRIPSQNIFYYRSAEHRRNYVMSFLFAFDNEDDVYQFSYCYPYDYSTLMKYLNSIEKRSYDFFKREILCHTVQHRQVDVLTITHPDNLKPDVRKRIVFVTARVHPGETPASFVCQGLIDYLTSNNRGAIKLRKHIVFKIIPMLNPDGVYLGNYRCSLMGFDLNRHWHDPSSWTHPSLFATKQLILEYDRDPNTELDFYIDIHAHSIQTNGFMYCNVHDDERRYGREAVFPRLLCQTTDDFSWNKTSFNRDPVKAGTGRRCLGDCLSSHTHCYTLEVSFYSYINQHTNAHIPYTEKEYNDLGLNVAKTFLEYYRL